MEFETNSIDLGDVQRTDVVPFEIPLVSGNVGSIYPSCSCTRVGFDPEQQKLIGTLTVASAVSHAFVGKMRKTFLVSDADSPGPCYDHDARHVARINPDKRKVKFTLTINVLPDEQQKDT